jgi:predicted branched-subunit amino acid permease
MLLAMTTDLLTRPTGRLTNPRADATRDLASIAPGLLPFGIALGVVIAATRMADVVGVIGAPVLYGGSAQLTATTMFNDGAGVLAILGAALTVNARLVLYGAALAPRFRDQPLWFRFSAPHLIIDQTYVSALARPHHAGRGFRVYWLWLGAGVMVVWTAAVGAGVLVGPRLPPLPYVTLAGAALFIGMLMPRLRDRPSIMAALTAAAIAPLIARFLPSAAILIGTLAGLLAGFLARKEEPS